MQRTCILNIYRGSTCLAQNISRRTTLSTAQDVDASYGNLVLAFSEDYGMVVGLPRVVVYLL